MEIGLISLADLTSDPRSDHAVAPDERIRRIVRLGQLAEQAGLDVFAVGEHHHPNYAVPSPAVVLAAVAQATERIRLTSATTLIGVLDPVRVYEDFATLDAVSGGRAEITVGRGAFPEPFDLFGYSMDDYDAVFTEHLDLLLQITRQSSVTWRGEHRPPLLGSWVGPRAVQQPLPVGIGVGGNRGSLIRAGKLGLPVTAAVTPGSTARLAENLAAYREAAASHGHDPAALRVATTGQAYVVAESAQAAGFYPYLAEYLDLHSRGRIVLDREGFERHAAGAEALLAGDPAQVAAKIVEQHRVLGQDRVLLQVDSGGLPFADVARTVELLGSDVVPAVRAALATTGTTTGAPR
ncbi:alkanesulfonate monooxygenase SsuD/methylene tetrahydromethanopterin reductase-like flavin-dependent oxidoreductase (luciferase family) [Micromonospora sp. Llam0]|uniref:LLM class flavin-dependent oxidoreductase n=1 Tax=Micromonospora sp. Llam0 TaxID=2485143 RepID=UPI000F46CA03|nr:LLM class flavin-dependent oxidoreductase [Micromonospora sp. Llam0]ROO60561.1 alkanesulfonate monooxygenase SsuD/methylene tetrahydromethanopterin reductase-like flavin-dependent oxidoreductase (luciferase family) [Micromonospora sp. Llam0]